MSDTRRRDGRGSIESLERASSDDEDKENYDENVQAFTSGEKFCTGIIFFFWLILSPLIIWYSFPAIPQNQRVFRFRFGKSTTGRRALKPGLIFTLPGDKLIRVDMRTRCIDIDPQQLLTSDSVSLSVDGVGFWRVKDAWLAYTGAEDYEEATNSLLSLSLRNVLSGRSLRNILHDREAIAREVVAEAGIKAVAWGVEISNVEINDVRIPEDLQQSMAAEAQASREASAKVALAKGELQSSKLLAQAARNLSAGNSSTAMSIRYLDTMNTLSNVSGSRMIIYPQ
eukprot:GHVH01007840.1.p1 GENE.GHVH01007840.1~~GHVH01007840.1.p1  ORF type:complete len:284 (+),score=41.23 GHVH01007840.1:1024-1875(+)